MVAAGGRTVVELTSGGLKPDPKSLVEISKASGANGDGMRTLRQRLSGSAQSLERGVDDFAAEMVGQVFEGAWGTDVRAGIIGEIGCQSPWTDLERRVMQGAIIAQQQTGAAINVHPGRNEDQPQEVADFFLTQGRADGPDGDEPYRPHYLR